MKIERFAMREVKKGRGYVYDLQYHLVFCTEYRKPVIAGPVRQDLYHQLNATAKKLHYQLDEINGEPDHVHLLVSCSPQDHLPTLVKQLKGGSARHILAAHPQLKQQLGGGYFWSPSYFIATVSENTEAQVRDYIRSQGRR